MTLVIAVRGAESEKLINGERKRVVPFVGADGGGEFAPMGVGFVYSDNKTTGSMWGLVTPHMLLKSWRGMKVLERIYRIDYGTLAACWHAGGKMVSDSNKHHLDELAEKLGGREKLEALRREILAFAPAPEELHSAIDILREKGIGIEDWELEEEMARLTP